MSRKSKLIARFLKKPKDFSWQELKSLLAYLGYEEVNVGKTAGSRVRFVHIYHPPITLHKPHPQPILKRYQVDEILNHLKQEGLL